MRIENKSYRTIWFENNVVKINVCSGISIFKFVTFISNNLKISGLEGLVGIPGSIGGAIYMNAKEDTKLYKEIIFGLTKSFIVYAL